MIDNVIYMSKRQFLTNQNQYGRLVDNYTTLNCSPLENSKYSIIMSKSVANNVAAAQGCPNFLVQLFLA